jgi:hypothetical protein
MIESHVGPDDERESREIGPSGSFVQSAPGKRRAEPLTRVTRVRSEFARHAHQRENHSEGRNKPCKEKKSRRKKRMEEKSGKK